MGSTQTRRSIRMEQKSKHSHEMDEQHIIQRKQNDGMERIQQTENQTAEPMKTIQHYKEKEKKEQEEAKKEMHASISVFQKKQNDLQQKNNHGAPVETQWLRIAQPKLRDAFIRERLDYPSEIRESIRNSECKELEHYRFDMSGYNDSHSTTQFILNKFYDLGIFDYTHYMVLDFYKGSPTIYLKYWDNHQSMEIGENGDLCGLKTIELITLIFNLTILQEHKQTRRRN